MIVAVIFSGVFNIIVSVINRKLSKVGADYSSIVKYVENVFSLKDYATELRTSPISNVIIDLYHKSTEKTWEYAKSQLSRMLFVDIADTITNNIIAYFGIVIYACYRISVTKEFNVDEFVILITGAFQLMSNCSGLLKSVIGLGDNKVRFGYYQNFLDMSADEDNFSKCTGCLIAKNSVCFENVSFGYKEDTKIIKELSIDIPIGTKVAILGANGAGKSTLIKLLLRFYKVSMGDIKIDGKSIYEYDIDTYKSLFSYVTQDPVLFELSLADNILMRKCESKDDEAAVINVLRQVGMYDKVITLKNGIYSRVGKEFDDNGVVFSGGELQKIAVARALLQDRPILIMDEPSSHLDPLSEKELFDITKNIGADKTVVYITHNIMNAVNADIIWWMSGGKVLEHGSHDELMKIKGDYYNAFITKYNVLSE